MAGAELSDSNSSVQAVEEGEPAPKRKRLFTKELKLMLHGFGDHSSPYVETVDAVEDMAVQFVQEMTLKAMQVGKPGKVHAEDIIFLIRKDPKKYARVKDLLTMNEELKKARRAFEEDPEAIDS